MSLLLSALETLDTNWLRGLFESMLDGINFFTSARYFSASVVSPDLMDEIRPLSAVPNESPELELEVELVAEVELVIWESRVLALCTLEINMGASFRMQLAERRLPQAWTSLGVTSLDARHKPL